MPKGNGVRGVPMRRTEETPAPEASVDGARTGQRAEKWRVR